MGPFDTISSIFLGETGGPFTAFGSMSLEQLWAHMTLSASFLFEKQLAHPWSSAEFFGSTNGLIYSFRQHISGATLGSYDTIGSISLRETVCPSTTIGSIFWQHQWAHSQLSAACLWSNIGPI